MPTRRLVDNFEIEQMFEEYKNGSTLVEIGARRNISKQAVSYRFQRNGIFIKDIQKELRGTRTTRREKKAIRDQKERKRLREKIKSLLEANRRLSEKKQSYRRMFIKEKYEKEYYKEKIKEICYEKELDYTDYIVDDSSPKC